jgi:ketosteroid isomerase-like protein
MSLDLPKPVAEYFAADHTGDAHALARCFADDSVVHDEGGTFRGTEEIRDWSAAARKKYHHTVEPLSVVQRDGATIVAGRVAGDFPGSPVTLDHVFRLDGDKIASLEFK